MCTDKRSTKERNREEQPEGRRRKDKEGGKDRRKWTAWILLLMILLVSTAVAAGRIPESKKETVVVDTDPPDSAAGGSTVSYTGDNSTVEQTYIRSNESKPQMRDASSSSIETQSDAEDAVPTGNTGANDGYVNRETAVSAPPQPQEDYTETYAPVPVRSYDPPAEQPQVHTHTWVHHDAVTHTVHHEAEYSTVHHDAVTEQRWVVDQPGYYVSKWICTGCGAEFSSSAEMSAHAEHYAVEMEDMSHGCTVTETYVAEVGHYEQVIVQAEYDETVELSPAWDETIIDVPAYDECPGCGARK